METNDKRIEAQEKAKLYWNMVGKRYRHFKGNVYEVIHIGVHSESEELMVVYHGVNDTKCWIRPLEMFLSKVDRVKYPNVEQELRFEPCDD